MHKKHVTVKRLLVLAACLCMLISKVFPAYAAEDGPVDADDGFVDVKKGAWYYDDVMKAKKAGLVQGIGNGKYGPDNEITYAQFITALVRVFKSEDEIPEGRIRNEVWVDFTRMVTSAMGIEYKEPEKHWSDKYIAAAQDMGIVNEFVIPDDPIPREVMMKYVVNALGLKPSESTELLFADVHPLDGAYIYTAYEEYLTEGTGRNSYGHKEFGFGKTALRSEMAAILNRVVAYRNDPEGYKAERAKARAEADAQNKISFKYITYNGYKTPASHTNLYNEYADFDFLGRAVYARRDDNGEVTYNFDDMMFMQDILASKLGVDAARKAVAIALEEKIDTFNEKTRTFVSGNYYITVVAYRSSATFSVSEYKGPELPSDYIVLNGYAVPDDEWKYGKGNVFGTRLYEMSFSRPYHNEISCFIWLDHAEKEKMFKEVEFILLSKHDAATVGKVMQYCRTKTGEEPLQLNKDFITEKGYLISVESAPRSVLISIYVYPPEYVQDVWAVNGN